MIKIHSASKSIESKVLFKNINFELENKKITGLLGANGAGKTSLFRAIAGLSRVDSGDITFFDTNVTKINIEKRSNLGLSYVPQENSLFEDLSLEDNLKSVLELKFSDINSEKINEMNALINLMNLHQKRATLAKFLSGGEKRKTEILRAVLLEARDILLDEPFAGVDPISVDEIIKVLKKLSSKVGIFISDHNFRDVINVCDEIILLNQGEVLLKGNPRDVKNNPLAKKFYFGDLN